MGAYFLSEGGSFRRLLSIAFGCAVTLLTAVFYVTGEASVALQLTFVAYLGAILLFVLRRAPRVAEAWRLLWVPIGYLALGSASILWNASDYPENELLLSIVTLVNTALLLLSGVILAFVVSRREFELAMTFIGASVALLITYALVVHWDDRVGDRFSGNGIHPNWWGSVGYGAACAAAFSRFAKLRLAVFGVAMFLCYAASSRGSILGILVLATLLMPIRSVSRRQWFLVSGLALIAIVVFWAFGGFNELLRFVLSDVFELDNRYRGMGTGFTGREEGWRAAFAAIEASPVFGVGHGNLPFVHNGYLLATGELGLLGGLFFVGVTVGSGLAKVEDSRLKAVAVSYLVFMLFAPRTFNLVLGSMIPTLCMMMCLALRKRASVVAFQGSSSMLQ